MDAAAFRPDEEALVWAVSALSETVDGDLPDLPTTLPDEGLGPVDALRLLAPTVLGQGRDLGAPGFFAHMDPPTPWVSWAATMWTASQNQNLLHPDTAPQARELEQQLMAWLAPFFGQSGGHMTPGSTVSNLTAVWAAREAGATEVVASSQAHLSVKKAAHLLGMNFRVVDDWKEPGDLRSTVAVLTAGTTSTGEIEPLDAATGARWRHLDAAWAGPLRLSDKHRALLDGVETFDSVSVSAHKWLFQPKESAMVLFADHESAHESISIDGAYLAVPNIGVLGSHGATAVPLMATFLAYGRAGIAGMLDRSIALADDLHELIEQSDDFIARSTPRSGVVCWRHTSVTPEQIKASLLGEVFVSTTVVEGEPWLRSVAANPMANPAAVIDGVRRAARSAPTESRSS